MCKRINFCAFNFLTTRRPVSNEDCKAVFVMEYLIAKLFDMEYLICKAVFDMESLISKAVRHGVIDLRRGIVIYASYTFIQNFICV